MGFDVLLANAIAYVLLFLYTLYKYKRINLYNSVILAFMVVAVLGYITTKMGIQLVGSSNFGLTASPIPYICCFLTVLLICHPFKKVDPDKIEFTSIDNAVFKKFIRFSVLVLVIVLLVKIYEVYLVLQAGFAEAYISKHFDGQKLIEFSNPILSFIATKGMTYYNVTFSVVLYYYFYRLLANDGRRIVNICCIILCFIPEVLESLSTGSKGMLFFNAFDLIFFYLFFERLLPPKIKRVFIIIGASSASLLIIYSIAIQNSRLDNSNTEKLASEVMLRYLGEAMPNLGDLYTDTKVHPYGDRFFPWLTGARQFASEDETAEYWTSITHARILNFKTIWGDCYVEFGIVGSFVFLGLFVFLCKKLVFVNYRKIYVFPLIYFYHHRVCIYGIFNAGFITYRTIQITIYLIILCLILKRLTNEKSNSNTPTSILSIS